MTVDLRVLRFSPDPEEIEYINVALLIGNGTSRLVYEHNFPRLSCIAPSFDISLLRYYLDDLQSRIGLEPFDRAAAIVAEGTSQFAFSEKRKLVAPLSDAVIGVLKSKYLGRGGPQRTRERSRVERELSDFLLKNLAIEGTCVMSSAKPGDFLSRGIAKKLSNNGISVARVVATPRHLKGATMESFLTGFWTTTGVIAGLTIFLIIGAVINAILGD